MSETALTLIKSALRVIGVIASGETPTDDEVQDGLQALKFMLRNWSAKNIRIYSVTQEGFALTGATSYTIGASGTFDTVRPASILGAYVRDSNNIDNPIRIIDEKYYREITLKSETDTSVYLWYNPQYPLGKIFMFPAGTGTLYIHSLKELAEPDIITSSVVFPPEYDEAIKYGLAVRLGPEYGKPLSQEISDLALGAIQAIETRNFASQINMVRPEIIRLSQRYDINIG